MKRIFVASGIILPSILSISSESLRENSWNSIGPKVAEFYAVAIDPQTPNTLYAASFNAGIFKSTDGGSNWTLASYGLGLNYCVQDIAIDPQSPSTIYAGTRDGGLFKSINSGISWSAINTGLADNSVRALAVHPQTTSTVYAGIYLGVFKSTNGGSSWTAMNTGLAPKNVSCHSPKLRPL